MSKTLEELGYKKQEYGKSYDIFSKSVDEEGYCIDSIVFFKKHKNIKINAIITMEELKAIYKWCEDNKWI